MGGFITKQKPPETGTVTGPALRTPFSDITAPLGHWNTKCGDYELRFLDCLEAHGPIQGEEKCKFYFQDFQECTQAFKQMERVKLMRDERNRQGFRRLANGESGDWFAEAPRLDSYAPEPMDSN